MNLFGWLWNSVGKAIPPTRDQQSLAFVTGLCEAHKPDVRHSSSAGYEWFKLLFPDLTIELTYGHVRNKWDVEMWCGKAGEFLFYYDCLSIRPTSTIAYLRDRFGLDEMVAEKQKKRAEKEKTGKEFVAELVQKYSKLEQS
jgi:hypothetical protein